MMQSQMMLPLKGAGFLSGVSNESGPAAAALARAGETGSDSFSKTLRELLDSGADACALILALQHAVTLPDGRAVGQGSGSFLPTAPGTGGSLLPLSGDQVLSPGSLPSPAIGDPEQLRSLLLGEKLPVSEAAGRLLSLKTEIPEALQQSDFKGLFDLAGELRGVASTAQNLLSSGAGAGIGTRAAIVLPLPVPVGQPGWEGGLGERIQWMLSRNVQQAEIKLSPPELGPLEIKISLHNDQSQVSFVAAHAATREALEAAIPRLREMFNEINLNLANVDVGQQQAGGTPGREAAASDAGLANGCDDASSPGRESPHPVSHLQSRGLLDTYA